MGTSTEHLVTFESVHPGSVLNDWLLDLGIKKKDFAKMIGLPPSRLSELVRGKRGITLEIAQSIATALGTSPDFWVRLQAQYEYNEKMLKLRNTESITLVEQEQKLESLLNIQELYRRFNIIAKSARVRLETLFRLLCEEYTSITTRYANVNGFFQRSEGLNIDERNFRTWVLLAKYHAQQCQRPKVAYSQQTAVEAANAIASLANSSPLTESDIKRILLDHGIGYAVVPKLPTCPIDAYSVLQGGVPAIVVTHRHNNMEKLIFNVLHELGHIALHMDGDNDEFVNVERSLSNAKESEANEFAQNTLIPPKTWEGILSYKPNSVNLSTIYTAIGRTAKAHGINPRIAVERYKHEAQCFRGGVYAHTGIV